MFLLMSFFSVLICIISLTFILGLHKFIYKKKLQIYFSYSLKENFMCFSALLIIKTIYAGTDFGLTGSRFSCRWPCVLTQNFQLIIIICYVNSYIINLFGLLILYNLEFKIIYFDDGIFLAFSYLNAIYTLHMLTKMITLINITIKELIVLKVRSHYFEILVRIVLLLSTSHFNKYKCLYL